MRTRTGLIIAIGLATGPAVAEITTVYPSGPVNLAIPSGAYDGSLGSMAASSITVPSIGDDLISAVRVEFAIQHTWVGDLVLKLEGPDHTLVTLLSRPGLAELADDGTGCCGYFADLSSAFPIRITDDAEIPSENMGMGLVADTIIGSPGSGSSSVYASSGFQQGPALSLYSEQSAVGEWTLHVGDAAILDAGVLADWTLTLTTVPEPSGALLPLFLLCLRLRGARK